MVHFMVFHKKATVHYSSVMVMK